MSNLGFLFGVMNDAACPDVVSINLTPYCNQHCKYCEIGNGKVEPDKPLLNLDDLKWIIDQMAENKIGLISIGGGEPLTVPWLWDVINYADIKGIKTEIITNGMSVPRLSQEQLNTLKLTSNVSISIDTIAPETEDYLRGVSGAYWKQMNGLSLLKTNNISFTIATVLTKYNYDSISSLVRSMDNKGARFVKFQPLWEGSNFPEVDGINKSSLIIRQNHIPELIAELHDIVDYEKDHVVKTNASDLLEWISIYLTDHSIPVFKSFVNKYWCHTIHSIITINYYGDVLPCNYRKTTTNISERKPLVDLWNEVCSDAWKTFKNGGCFPECCGCTSSIEMGLICSGIRWPITNYRILPKVYGMIKSKLRKQQAIHQ